MKKFQEIIAKLKTNRIVWLLVFPLLFVLKMVICLSSGVCLLF